MSEKLYTAQELIDLILSGWSTEKELKDLYELVDRAKMKNDEELKKLLDSGYVGLLYAAYEE